MRRLLFGMIAFHAATSCGLDDALAQAPRRSVTLTFQRQPVARAQWSSDSNESPPPAANPANVTPTPTAGSLPQNPQGLGNNSGSSQAALNGTASQNNSAPRPNTQQMQNPSGAFNLSHAGMTQNQNTTPNSYLGPQFDQWNNLRQQPRTLDEFQAFNRTQPPQNSNSGAYFSPNTYFGPGYSQWNNMTSGAPTQNYLGGYTYRP